MKRRSPIPTGIVAALMAASCASAGEPLPALTRLMRCVAPPDPTPVLRLLGEAGLIGERSGPGYDDESCWPFLNEPDWEGVSFTEICAVVAAPAIAPELYYVGETSAPFSEVWLVSTLDTPALASWAHRTMPRGSRYEIDEANGIAALSCSEWDFPLLPTE